MSPPLDDGDSRCGGTAAAEAKGEWVGRRSGAVAHGSSDAGRMRKLVVQKAVLKDLPELPAKQYRQVVTAIFDLLADPSPALL